MSPERQSGEVFLSGELTRQKALLDELFASVPEAVVLLDADSRILRVNPEFTKMFGYPQEEALGRRINELFVPEEMSIQVEESAVHSTRGEILNLETVRKRRSSDGT